MAILSTCGNRASGAFEANMPKDREQYKSCNHMLAVDPTNLELAIRL